MAVPLLVPALDTLIYYSTRKALIFLEVRGGGREREKNCISAHNGRTEETEDLCPAEDILFLGKMVSTISSCSKMV